MSDRITLGSAALDCPDARQLAAFYADITGGRVTFENDQWATVDGPGGRIDFRPRPVNPPAWPDPTRRSRCTSTSMSTTWPPPRLALAAGREVRVPAQR